MTSPHVGARRLTLLDVIRQPPPGLDRPTSIAFAPGGHAVTYLQSTDGSLVQSLWWHDLETGGRHALAGPTDAPTEEGALSHEERLRRERTRMTGLGVAEYAWSTGVGSRTLLVPRAGEALVAVAGDGRGVADAGAGAPELRPLVGVDRASCTILSPDGRQLAFVRDGDVWVCPTTGGTPRRLTHDAEPGVTNGLAEYVAAEELGRFDGLWWSADSAAIAVARADEREIPPVTIAHLAAEEPRQEEHRYPFAGGPNARVSLRIATLDGETLRAVALPMAQDDYLARVVARPAGGWLVAVLPRPQHSLVWCFVDQDGSVHDAWTEGAEPWVNLDDDTRVLSDGRILRTTESSGFRHLELRRPDGTFDRPLTTGDWVVTGVAHVDEERDEVLFVGTRHGVTQRHLYRVALDTPHPVGDPDRLTAAPGWHETAVSRDGGRWVDSWSSLTSAPTCVVRGREGTDVRTIHAPSATTEALGVAPPELIEVMAADGRTLLHAAFYAPTAATEAPPPCVVSVYGGPHVQLVKDSWELTVAMQRQYLRAAGTAVLVVDNRGSAYRGRAFEAALGGRLGGVEVADQAAVVRELGAAGRLDLQRVGITGGSYGGFMTVRCMAGEPDLFRVGVAVAPVTAWDGYDTAYTERYLGMPGADAERYHVSSALPTADRIRGDLLLIHGALDENVHLRHSVRLLTALQRAEIDAGFVLLGDERHRVRGHAALHVRERRISAHLLSGLGLPLPGELERD